LNATRAAYVLEVIYRPISDKTAAKSALSLNRS